MSDVGSLVIDIHVTGVKRWTFRVWLMARLIALAGWIAPKNVHINIEL